jgi:ABC-type multidrug transport system fused ATPase/permease subunit
MVQMEVSMIPTERMMDYAQLPPESSHTAKDASFDQAIQAAWAKEGGIQVTGVSASYQPNLPLVLSNLSFSLAPGESCGVVGRTGSGMHSVSCVCSFWLSPAHDAFTPQGKAL